MAEWLHQTTEFIALCIDIIALAAIAYGTLEAVWGALRLVLSPGASNPQKRHVWLQYARWLVVGLTFQLASDIIETSIAPSWDEIGQLAAIAAIRTFLNYFLERDLGEMRELDHSRQSSG